PASPGTADIARPDIHRAPSGTGFRVIIAGGRRLTDYPALRAALDEVGSTPPAFTTAFPLPQTHAKRQSGEAPTSAGRGQRRTNGFRGASGEPLPTSLVVGRGLPVRSNPRVWATVLNEAVGQVGIGEECEGGGTGETIARGQDRRPA